MAGTSINCLAIVLKELGWSYTRLIAELRRQAAIDGVVLPKTESLIRLISRWVNNHQQPDEFYSRRGMVKSCGSPVGDDHAATSPTSSGRSTITPLSKRAPARTSATRCGPLTARQRS